MCTSTIYCGKGSNPIMSCLMTVLDDNMSREIDWSTGADHQQL